MRQSEVTGLKALNDNPKNVGQKDMFDGLREIIVGPSSIGESIKVLGSHVDGLLVIHEIIERGDGPVEVFS